VTGRAAALAALLLLLGPRAGAGADPVRGARVFQRCYACHSVLAGEDKLPGPNLRCVIGRRAGTLGAFEFSPAMVAAGARGLDWSREALARFLADPEAAVPGTAMAMPGLRDAGDRGDVIDYLEASATGEPPCQTTP
jgi:cytochrome c